MDKYNGSYIDGTNQDTFNASFDALLKSFDNLGECLYVECLKCKHQQPDSDFYTCEKCGHNTGVAHYTETTPSTYPMVEGEGAPQYTFDIPANTQLSLL